MRELSLFTGAGGGLLGTSLLEWELVGCVEWDNYCQRLLRQRMEDGLIERAPIYGDIRAFISEGYAERYRGMVDIITAGFPCQPFSVAGNQAGADDPRNMWPATIECIRIIRPQFALLENVPGLLASGYFGRVLGDLAESGYDVRWRVLSAAEVGAPHQRDRLWIAVDTSSNYRNLRSELESDRQEEQTKQIRVGSGRKLANADSKRQQQSQGAIKQSGRRSCDGGKEMADTSSEGSSLSTCPELCSVPGESKDTQACEPYRDNAEAGTYWTVEPDVGRVAHGVASRVDRLKALGNGQVPAVVRAAWELLTEDFNNE